MVQVNLPFETNPSHPSGESLNECGLLPLLSDDMKEACERVPHLLDYLHVLPIDKIDMPEFHAKLSRNLADVAYRNLLYQVSDQVLVHVWSDSGGERDVYIPVEPSVSSGIINALAIVEERLLDLAPGFGAISTSEDRQEALLNAVASICKVSENSSRNGAGQKGGLFKRFRGGNGGGKISVSARDLEAIKYLILRDKVGLGVLQPVLGDTNIEDISCSGLGPIFLEHKVFKGMRSAVVFETHDQLDGFVLRLSEQIMRPVTMRNPIVDAVLPDGSRINIVYGREVSQRGSNFTIRRFADTPMSILQLIDFGSMDYRMAAYLSIILEEGMNVFVAGETASGKTALMNSITTFVPPMAKVISIEDTPEVQVPHPNWLREVAKAARADEKAATVTMMDLLKAALRQRPNLIIIVRSVARRAP